MDKKKIVKAKEDAPQINCSKCQSLNVEMQYGYGYYFKCLSCDGNTALKLKCKDSKCKPKIQKRKLVFHQVCDVCGEKKLFFTNKELVVL